MLYNIAIRLYAVLIRIVSPFSPKAKAWLRGRKDIFKVLEQKFKGREHQKVIWIHCASLGEFEQGRPIIELIKSEHPEICTLLTFFSPSGFLVRQNYDKADIISYLPLDTKKNAERFIDITHPDLVIFIKYEFWKNILSHIHQKQIPAISVATIFRMKQFEGGYGRMLKKILPTFEHLFLQDENSLELLHHFKVNVPATITGDPRFDRVYTISRQQTSMPWMERFVEDQQVLVAGSVWPEDMKILYPLIKHFPDLKMIFAPHEMNKKFITEMKQQLGDECICYTGIQQQSPENYRFIIVDTIGLLSSLYKLGTITYVGGAFGKGLHNILEAASHGKPVLFGPKHKKFREARDLIKLNAAYSIQTSDELKELTSSFLEDDHYYNKTCYTAKRYIEGQTGATNTIFSYITEHHISQWKV